jgi:hypothetical protein
VTCLLSPKIVPGKVCNAMTTNPNLVSESDIALARAASPEMFLRRHYADVAVNRRGDSISVDKVLRADFRDGHWVSCGWHSEGIGDNIRLARWVLGESTKFADAVGEVLGRGYTAGPAPAIPRERESNGRPRVPPCRGIARGRAYLADRGIGPSLIRRAEDAGVLSYVTDGVVFLGRDWAHGQEVRLGTIRYYEDRLMPNGKLGNKRDLADSDKSYPFFLPGDPSLLIVVEGAINALAAAQIREATFGSLPCVVATGGVGILSWLAPGTPLLGLASGAGAVEVWGENETDRSGFPNAAKQALTDAQRSRLLHALAEIRDGEIPDLVYPPPRAKDAAEWLLALNVAPEDGITAPAPAPR